MKSFVAGSTEISRRSAHVCIAVAAMLLLTCGVAAASDCDATTSPDFCQPAQVRAFAAAGGIENILKRALLIPKPHQQAFEEPSRSPELGDIVSGALSPVRAKLTNWSSVRL